MAHDKFFKIEVQDVDVTPILEGLIKKKLPEDPERIIPLFETIGDIEFSEAYIKPYGLFLKGHCTVAVTLPGIRDSQQSMPTTFWLELDQDANVLQHGLEIDTTSFPKLKREAYGKQDVRILDQR